jgi:hypothetical protein
MKNKAKLAFDLLEQEMEVICKEEQVRFTGGSGSYTYEQLVAAFNSGDLSSIPAGTYVSSGGMFTYYEQGYVCSNGASTYGFSISSGGYFDGGNFGGYSGTGFQDPPTDCVFKSMALLGELYGDYSLKFDSMKNNYNFLYSGAISAGIIKPASGGVDGYLLPSFVDQYFNRDGSVTTISQLSSFMAAGGDNFAIGTYSTGAGDGHAIVITGITADGSQYIYNDPQNSLANATINTNLITSFVAVTGKCN